ncbi:hypothetical protein SASPL_103692 [Salvia splendens]|uniref:Uncharacterized protein n=1 Tax=Salvia splendens TaxID=180675 RepID=A0A8X9A8D5_SALSN|nr:hypothetical protein SASPL_103692 [Salvia splendens]
MELPESVPPPAPLSEKKENVTPINPKIAELAESRQELVSRIQNLKQDLQNWRMKLDTQVKVYRDSRILSLIDCVNVFLFSVGNSRLRQKKVDAVLVTLVIHIRVGQKRQNCLDVAINSDQNLSLHLNSVNLILESSDMIQYNPFLVFLQELSELKKSLNTEVDQLRTEFQELRTTLQQQQEDVAASLKNLGDDVGEPKELGGTRDVEANKSVDQDSPKDEGKATHQS